MNAHMRGISAAIALAAASFGSGCAGLRDSSAPVTEREALRVWPQEILAFRASQIREQAHEIAVAKQFGQLKTSEEQRAFLEGFNIGEQLLSCPESLQVQLRAALLSQAVDSSVIHRISALRLERPQRSLVVEGDPSLGTIVFIGQTHKNPLVPGLHATQIAHCQRLIFRELIRDKASTVLSEGKVGEIGKRVIEPVSGEEAFQQRLIKCSDSSVYHSLSVERQLLLNRLFAELDAATLYGMSFDEGVGVYGYTDPSKAQETSGIISQLANNILTGKHSDASLDYRIMEQREGWLADTCLQYLQLNPGSIIHVVFGADHQFDAQDFVAHGKTPCIERVDFLADQLWDAWNGEDAIEASLLALADRPALQVEFVKSLSPTNSEIPSTAVVQCANDEVRVCLLQQLQIHPYPHMAVAQISRAMRQFSSVEVQQAFSELKQVAQSRVRDRER